METQSQKAGNVIGLIGLGFGILLCLLTMFLTKKSSYIQTVVSIYEVYPCVKQADAWIEVDTFKVDDQITVCGRITSSDPSGKARVEIRVYQKELTSQRNAIYYEIVNVENGNATIPIDIDLDPDIYIVDVSDGIDKHELVSFKVVEGN